MKVLVTGANGFVGSHIVEELLEKGHEPACLIRSTSNLRWIKELKVEYRLGDVTETEALPEIVKDVDAIIHAAGTLRATTEEAYYTVNQHATRAIAQAALTHNPSLKKFVFISSQAAMGPSLTGAPKPVNEEERPVSDYGKSKLAGEKELRLLEGSIPYTILRPAAVYGPRDKDIFIFFNLVKYRLRPMPLAQRRLQLLFVKDLARFAVEAISNEKSSNKIYALAEEKAYSWGEIAGIIAEGARIRTLPLPLPDLAFHITSAIAEQIGRLMKQPAVLNRQKVDEMLQSFWIADVSDARKDLGLDFTNFSNGAKITYQWYKENNWF